MTCRHSDGDISCSSHPSNVEARQYSFEEEKRKKLIKDGTTPDSSNYEILDIVQVGAHLVMKVLYPNCVKCAYEGVKIMVILNTSPLDALKWKKIDPHFRQPPSTKSIKEAPPPAARFPNSKDGWEDAMIYAEGKR